MTYVQNTVVWGIFLQTFAWCNSELNLLLLKGAWSILRIIKSQNIPLNSSSRNTISDDY